MRVNILPIHVKTQQHIMASLIYFHPIMSNSTNAIVHFEERRSFMSMNAGKVAHNLFRWTLHLRIAVIFIMVLNTISY